jgi:predicted dehydrogenase
MPKPIHVGLVGTKFMGRAHSNALAQVAHFFDLPRTPVMHTAVGRNAKELASFAARWGWQRISTRWQDLAEDGDIGLVDVATPNDLHAEPAIAMLEAGKHVACEKPLAGTLAEARAMRDAAKRAKKSRTFVWYNYRRCPAVALAHQLVKEGRIGRVYHVRATYLQSWGGPETPLLWRFQKDAAGSGAHGDLNAHIVDMCRFVTGEELTEVHGAVARTFVKERTIPGTKKKGKSTVDDAVLFLASLTGGGVASFEATRLAAPHQNANSLEVNGEKGSLRFDFEDMNLLRFHDASRGPREGGWTRIMCTSSAGKHPYAGQWWPDAHVLGYEHGFVNMLADVLRVLGGEKPTVPLPDFEDAYQTQRVLEAAMLSAKERCAVPLSAVK